MKGDIHSGRLWDLLQCEYNALLLVFFLNEGPLSGQEHLRGPFVLRRPRAALLVCGVSFPRGSSGEWACRLHRANCCISSGPLTSGVVLTRWMIGVSGRDMEFQPQLSRAIRPQDFHCCMHANADTFVVLQSSFLLLCVNIFNKMKG